MNSFTYAILGFFAGVLVSIIFLKNRKLTFFETLILDFKKSIDELKNLNEQNSIEIKTVLKSSENLSKTLTTNQNIKGKFGEECLENILKVCFPNENVDYVKQFVTKNNEYKTIKPDYLINLPNNNSILIDCKLNLEKFVTYKEKIDTEFENIAKKELISDINSTINNLSNKKYETALNAIQPNFVFMYIPLEPLITLIYTDNDFLSVIKNAYDKNIIIVGNSGILTSIRLTKEIWANTIQNNNIENIISKAEIIYNLIAQHSKNMANLKKIVSEFNLSFEKEYEKFISDSKIFKVTQELKDYGISTFSKKVGKKIENVEIVDEFLK